MFAGYCKYPLTRMMRLVCIDEDRMQNLPVFLHVDGPIVIIIILGVIVRLVSSIVVRRAIHVRVVTTGRRLLP